MIKIFYTVIIIYNLLFLITVYQFIFLVLLDFILNLNSKSKFNFIINNPKAVSILLIYKIKKTIITKKKRLTCSYYKPLFHFSYGNSRFKINNCIEVTSLITNYLKYEWKINIVNYILKEIINNI